MAVLIELLLVFVDVGRKVAGGTPLGEQGVPRLVPLVEVIGVGVGMLRVAEQTTVRGGERFPGVNHDGALFAGGFKAALDDEDLGLAVQTDVEPIEAFVQDVAREVGGMNLDGLFVGESADPEVRAAFKDVDFDPVIPLRGQDGELHLAVVVQPEIIPAAEIDLGAAGSGPQLIPLDQSQVDLTPLGTEVRCPLDEDIAADIGQAGEARGIIAVRRGVRLSAQAERNGNEESDR
jgi:hypothetical protein